MSRYRAIRHDVARLTAYNARFQGAMDNNVAGRFSEQRYGVEANKAGYEIWRRARDERKKKKR